MVAYTIAAYMICAPFTYGRKSAERVSLRLFNHLTHCVLQSLLAYPLSLSIRPIPHVHLKIPVLVKIFMR